MAMTKGEISGKHSNQFLICKKGLIPNENGWFLLDAKKSAPIYGLSEKGKQYYANLSNSNENGYAHEFAAKIECQLKVRIVSELFEMLYNNEFFSIWTTDAPLKYFDGCEYGYIVVFRVFRLKNIIEKSLMEKG